MYKGIGNEEKNDEKHTKKMLRRFDGGGAGGSISGFLLNGFVGIDSN